MSQLLDVPVEALTASETIVPGVYDFTLNEEISNANAVAISLLGLVVIIANLF